jgi:ABC-2 type transport system permease protein
MPIYEQGYRRYQARGPLRRLRFWPITREALRLVLVKRAFLVLLAACFVPFVVRTVQIWVVTRFPQAGRVLPVDGRLFGQFLNQQVGLAILLSIFGGAGLVANDLRTGAILVYLSRPLTRRDYVLGKLGALLALNLSITLVPGLALYAAGLALAPELLARWSLAWIAPAVVIQSLVVALTISLVALAVSALSRSARVSGLAFFGLLAALEIARGVLFLMFRRPEVGLVSIQSDVRAVGASLFDLHQGTGDVHWALAAGILVVVGLGCLAILRARVRAVEVVR